MLYKPTCYYVSIAIEPSIFDLHVKPYFRRVDVPIPILCFLVEILTIDLFHGRHFYAIEERCFA